MKQKTLFKISDYTSEFGGSLQENKRKTRRPLSTNLAHHFVLSAETAECGSLVRHQNEIINTINRFAEKFGITIHRRSINSNHCHLLLQFTSRLSYQYFIRAVTGTLALKLKVKWTFRPYSKMVSYGQEFRGLDWYIDRNQHEAWGVTEYKSRRKKAPSAPTAAAAKA